MSEDTTLGELFDGYEPEEPEAPEPVEQSAEPEATETPEPETDTGVEEAAPPAVEEPEDETPPKDFVPAPALAEERQKRQELQRELDELRGQVTAMRTPQPEPEKPQDVDLLDDPDAWAANTQAKAEQRVNQAEANFTRRFIAMSEAQAKARHGEAAYTESATAFAAAAKENPSLFHEMMAAPDPAEYVVKAGQKLNKLSATGGDLDALIEQEKAKAVADALAAERAKKTDTSVDVPESLTTETGATQRRDTFEVPSTETLFDS